MGVVNYGNQVITFSYGEEARAKNWNKLNYKIIPPGIYSGGVLSLIGVNQVSISPLVCYIDDDLTGVGINVETTTNVSIVVAPSTPYVILRMTWIDSTGIFMDVLPMALSNILPTDLIVGKAVYVNGIIQSFFDNSLRSDSLITKIKNRRNEFVVTAIDQSPTSQVEVTSGTFITNKKFITVAGGLSPALSNTTQGRTDLIYIDDTGAIQKLEGVDAITPVTPAYHGRMVIAEIHRGPTRTDVQSQDIVLINFNRYTIGSMSIDTYYVNWGATGLQVNASQIPIVSSLFGTPTVENALQVLAGRKSRRVMTAAGTVNAQKTVVQSQGNIKQFSTTPFQGSAYQLPSVTTQSPLSGNSSVFLSPGLAFVLYQDSSDTGKLKAVIRTINTDNSITDGNPVTIDAVQTNSILNCWVYRLTNTSVLIVYENNNGTKQVSLVACSVSGNTITVGTPIKPTSEPATSTSLIAFGLFSPTQALVIYEYWVLATGSGYVQRIAANIINITGIALASTTQQSVYSDTYASSSIGSYPIFADIRNINFMASGTRAYSIFTAYDASLNKWSDKFLQTDLISGGTALSFTLSLTNVPTIVSTTRSVIYGNGYQLNTNYGLFRWRSSNIEFVKLARIGNGTTLHSADLISFYPFPSTGLGSIVSPSGIIEADVDTFITTRIDSANNFVSSVCKIVGENLYIIDVRVLLTNVSITSSMPTLCKIDKTRYLLTYGDATDSNKVKSRIIEFLCIPSTIVGIAKQTVTAGQNCVVAFGKIIDGFSALTPSGYVYVDVDGSIIQSNTIGITIGKAITATQILTNVIAHIVSF